jgi:hypothetical protein
LDFSKTFSISNDQTKGSLMLSTVEGVSLLTLMEIVGPVLLALALAYGISKAARRPKGRAEQDSVRATRAHFREERGGNH